MKALITAIIKNNNDDVRQAGYFPLGRKQCLQIEKE